MQSVVDCAQNMVVMAVAPRQVANATFIPADCVKSTAASRKASALTRPGARPTLLPVGGVPNTAVKEPANQRGVKQMSKPADYAQNMAEMEAAASRNAFVTFKIVDCAYTTEGKRLDGASILAAASRL